MPNTYTWDCRTVDTYTLHTSEDTDYPDVIHNVHFVVTASDGVNQVQIIGIQELPVSDLSGFTPFDEITNDQITQWTQAEMGTELLNEVYEKLDWKLSEIKSPTIQKRYIEK
jgi:hypothetical protein